MSIRPTALRTMPGRSSAGNEQRGLWLSFSTEIPPSAVWHHCIPMGPNSVNVTTMSGAVCTERLTGLPAALIAASAVAKVSTTSPLTERRY
eukprot:COSAG01_NODE_3227_length_6384_cov_6.269690_2_plen_91_part_00